MNKIHSDMNEDELLDKSNLEDVQEEDGNSENESA